jgi:hypothetical protein
LLQALKASGPITSRLSPTEQAANLSADGYLEYGTPIMKVTTTTTRLGSTVSREIEFFDRAAADIFIRQGDNAFLPPTGEEVEGDE